MSTVTPIERLLRVPSALGELVNVLLTTDDARIGVTPRDAVWLHNGATLYRYRSSRRCHPVPVLLVFALINRPEIFDLREGGSLVQYLLDEGFDVFLLDWGYPDDQDADVGLDDLICDQLGPAVRETLRASGCDELTLVGWCMGATMCAVYCALDTGARQTSVRNLALLTMPIDGRSSTYASWVGGEHFDEELLAELWGVIPGVAIDFANKLLKPVTNFFSVYRRLWEGIRDGTADTDAYRAMAKWVADNPALPGRAWAQWIRWMYKDGSLVGGRMRLRGMRVDLRRIDQNLLVVTAAGDHIAPRTDTIPIFDLVASEDVTHFDRGGGHIGLVAGSKAKHEIWPQLAEWLRERSGA